MSRVSRHRPVLGRLPGRLLGLCIVGLLLAGLVVAPSIAQVEPEKRSDVSDKAFRAAELTIDAMYSRPGNLPAQAATGAEARLLRLGANNGLARVDFRSGRFATLAPATPLVPGPGVGNHLKWADLGVPAAKAAGSQAARDAATLQAMNGYLAAHAGDLGIDVSELGEGRVTSHDDGRIYQLYIPRMIEGIPVRGAYVTGIVNNGNLSLMGVQQWADHAGDKAGRPQLSADEARRAAEAFLSPLSVVREWGKPHQEWIATDRGQTPSAVQFSQGYGHRLAWSMKFEVAGDSGSWETLVDAHTGEVIANEDTNRYAETKGGVLPVTNDGIVPDGIEQAGWPMPYMYINGGADTTDTGGNTILGGSLTGNLDGPFIRMNDNCGSISLTQTDGLDFGTSGGTDCTTPGLGGPGNTHASRTGFYELNKMVEMAQGWLPTNSWLQQQMTSNMNINSTCNAFWNGSTVNFYRSGGGCSNTGEIAGVFDHEWGHGMDDNDANPTISSPSGEGIADIYTALRLNDSCIGRNFRSTVCTGFGDPCLTCTGVRDIDYEQRQSGQPHDYTWSNANCGTSVHCLGSTYSEAVWSLWKRKLQSAPYNYDNNTAYEIVNRLTFIGAGNVGTWFSGGPPYGGCSSSGGYLNYLAVDDDNGNLNDGTPHMQAIFDAFNDQEIACDTPTVQDSGCAGVPTTPPSVTGTPGNTSASLSWGAVAGASEYSVFRTEGVFACDFGKVRLGSTTGTSWNDSGLQNGRDYSYVVIPKGSADACFGPASSCTTVTPVAAPDFTVSCSPASQSVAQGDTGAATCTVRSLGGYTGTISLSCSGNPAGIGCSFAPTSVSPPANGDQASSLTLAVDVGQATGTFAFDVVGNDGLTTKTSSLTVQVLPAGQNGPQIAAYDAGLGAPTCSIPGTECDSTSLLDGRANLGPEPNAPNTLDGCTDGTSGSYHSDESNDRIVVRTLDGYDFTEGATVEVSATVWAWSTGSSDTLDLYFTGDANSPNWQLIGSLSPSSGGANTLTTQYTLPAGSLQAVRANFRYTGTQSPCSGGAYDDADDLVFAVGGGVPECTVDADCDDSLYCNGTESCNAGSCQSGTAIVCDDGVGCTVDTCNEATDSCDSAANDGLCDDGLFCNGLESCDVVFDCQGGVDPCMGGLLCDEANDVCTDPNACFPKGDACVVDEDCCSNKCRGPAGRKTCK